MPTFACMGIQPGHQNARLAQAKFLAQVGVKNTQHLLQ